MKTVNGTGRHGSQPPSLTGRDGYIVGQALYWFIREQQKLPKEHFEWSNVEDAHYSRDLQHILPIGQVVWIPAGSACPARTHRRAGVSSLPLGAVGAPSRPPHE